jgi:hypothetical protein
MRDNFLNLRGVFGPLGILPALAGALGIAALWKKGRRLALAFVIVLASHAALTVIYFNIPTEYFRSLDRHYLPVGVTFAVLLAYGLGNVVARVPTPPRPGVLAAAGALAALAPLAQLGANWTGQDASQRHFAHDYAVNALESLPENAIYLTVGDNDTFPVWYAQAVEHVRPDVRIVNLSMANAEWYLAHLKRTDPAFPLSLDAEQRSVLQTTLAVDTTIVVPASGSPGEAVTLRVRPESGSRYQLADLMLLDLVTTNAWRRPITFASTAGQSLNWLSDHARLEGLHWQVLPNRSAVGDTGTLRANLLNRYTIRGFADSAGPLERESVVIAMQYVRAFSTLMEADAKVASDRCRQTARRMLAVLPPDRLGVPQYDASIADARCGTGE